MGAVGGWITHALYNRHFPCVVKRLERGHVGVETQSIVDGQDLIFWNPHVGAIVVVQRVRVGNQRIQNVVATR